MRPIWSPDGQRIVYRRFEANEYYLMMKDAAGTSEPQTLLKEADELVPSSLSPDGQTIALSRQSNKTKIWDIEILPMTCDRKPRPFLAGSANENLAVFSPDGNWLAYESGEPEKSELYAVPFPGPGGKWQISASGVSSASYGWAGEKQIFFLSPERKAFVVDVTSRGGSLLSGTPRLVLGGAFVPEVFAYSQARKQFLIAVPTSVATSAPLVLVTNWTRELNKP